MSAQVYDIDSVRSKRGIPGWNDLDADSFVQIDLLSTFDERANFGKFPFKVIDNLRYQTHFPDEIEFVLIGYFEEPRTRSETESFFANELPGLLDESTVIDEPLVAYMDRIVSLGLLKPWEGSAEPYWEAGAEPVHFVAPPMQNHDKTVRSFPMTVGINLTERCNLACLHCCVGSGPQVSTDKDLTPEELSSVFDQLEAGGVDSVRLTGGEPTVRPDFWPIFEDAVSRRFSLVLFTNGTRIRDDDIVRLKDATKRKGSRFSIHLSLDGGSSESHDFLRDSPGNFRKVSRTMALFQEHGIHFFVESVLHKGHASAEEIDRIAGVVHKYGATWLSLHPAEQIGTGEGEATISFTREELMQIKEDAGPVLKKWAKKGVEINLASHNYPLVELSKSEQGGVTVKSVATEQREEPVAAPPVGTAEWQRSVGREIGMSRSSGYNVCTSGVSQIAISADGGVYGCPRYIGSDEDKIGDVRGEKLLDIWTSPKWDWMREDFESKVSLCKNCDYQSACFYGKTCRANPGRLFNDRYGVSPDCIREYSSLGLPYGEVVAYLNDRIEANPDDAAVLELCEHLLVRVAETEAAKGARPPAAPSDSQSN